jgi:predicted kinase
VARLLLLNGPPGIGKTTIAWAYVQDHPLALSLDVDLIRAQLGGWQADPQAGLVARALAVEMARVHLGSGRDVAVPQYLGRLAFVEALEAVAASVGAEFVEAALMDGKAAAIARFISRSAAPEATAPDRQAATMAGGEQGLAEMYDRLEQVIAARPRTIIIQSVQGDPDGTYRRLKNALTMAS